MSLTAPAPAAPARPAPDLARARAMALHPAGSARRPGVGATPAPPVARGAGTGGGLAYPTMDDVRMLAAASHPLSVSLLLVTSPADRMLRADRDRLLGLAGDADRRLADEEADPADRAALARGLAAAIDRAVAGPTDRGLAILASPSGVRVHHLRVRPRERVVVDPTFATRDLIRSATEDPPFLLLTLDDRSAQLFHYDQRYLRPVLDHDFPMLTAMPSPRGASAPPSKRAQSRALLRRADARLAARLRRDPLPLVLVAPEHLTAELLAVGSLRVSAAVRSGPVRMALADLERVGRRALAGHVTDRAAAALEAVHTQLRSQRAVAGLDAAWRALRAGEPEMVVVERSYATAVRVTDDGFVPAPDPAQPGVIDDAVDELLEAVLTRGGQVITVPDGALQHHGRLVLVLHGPTPRAA